MARKRPRDFQGSGPSYSKKLYKNKLKSYNTLFNKLKSRSYYKLDDYVDLYHRHGPVASFLLEEGKHEIINHIANKFNDIINSESSESEKQDKLFSLQPFVNYLANKYEWDESVGGIIAQHLGYKQDKFPKIYDSTQIDEFGNTY